MKLKSFGEIRHSISCRDCDKPWMAFSRTLLAVLNSGVSTRWRLACIIYDIVLATEFFSCFLGSRFLYPLCETGFIVTDKGATVPLCSYKWPFCSLWHCSWIALSLIHSLHSLSFPVLYHSQVCVSSLSHTSSFLTSICLVSSQIPVSVLHICFSSAALRLRSTLPPFCLHFDLLAFRFFNIFIFVTL